MEKGELEAIILEWDNIISYIRKIMPDELIDPADVNGYVKPSENGYKLGIFYQGLNEVEK